MARGGFSRRSKFGAKPDLSLAVARAARQARPSRTCRVEWRLTNVGVNALPAPARLGEDPPCVPAWAYRLVVGRFRRRDGRPFASPAQRGLVALSPIPAVSTLGL